MVRFAAVVGAGAALLAGCASAPAPVLRYQETDAEAQWRDGAPLRLCKGDSLGFAVSLRGPDDAMPYGNDGTCPVAFAVEVRNLSGRRVAVDPADFFLAFPADKTVLAAIDPEAGIRSAQADINSEQARMADDRAANGVLDVIDLVGALASDFGGSREERDRAHEYLRSDEAEDYRRESANTEILRDLRERIRAWSTLALRKNTLAPDSAAAGQLLFPIVCEAPPDSMVLEYRVSKHRGLRLAAYSRVNPPVNK